MPSYRTEAIRLALAVGLREPPDHAATVYQRAITAAGKLKIRGCSA